MTQQKMTETNKSNEKIEMLMQLLASKPELIDVLLDNILAEGKKKKKPIWRGRKLILFPNETEQYLTLSQQKVKQLVDELVSTKKLSKKASENAMNRFYGNTKIRGLSKEDRLWAKHYYKQYILDWSVIRK